MFLDYYKFWIYHAFVRCKLLYKQTLLGILWEPVALLIVALFISIVWSQVLQEDEWFDFFLYVFCGLYIWSFISVSVLNGVRVFELHKAEIINEHRSLFFYVYQRLFIGLFRFLIPFPIVFALILFGGHGNVIFALIFFVLSMSLIFISAVGFVAFFGGLANNYKDIAHVIEAVMRLAFLLTPIIWKVDRLQENQWMIWLNPFYAYVDLARTALLYGQLSLMSLMMVVLQSLVLIIAAKWFVRKNQNAIRRRGFVS